MKKIINSILLTLAFSSCSNEKIEITYDYIVNPNWDEQANAIKIERVLLKKDSIINPFLELHQEEILSKLVEDSSFRWYAAAKIKEGESYKAKKIYFNKDNGFTWLNDVTGERSMVFGNFSKNTWYKFSRLFTHPYYIYIFVDSTNTVHRFDVNLANY